MIQRFKLLSLLTLFVLLVGACGGAQPTPSPAAEPPKPAAETPAQKAETPPTHGTEMTTTLTLQETTVTTTTSPITPTTGEGKTSPLPNLGGRKVVVGSDTTYPPMEFVDEKTKEISGFDVDMMKEISKLLNINVEFRTFPNFDAIFAALANKEFDLVVSSVSVTEERKKIIDFSDPYLSIGQAISVQRNNTTISSQADLAKASRVGVQGGTTGEEAAKKAGVPEANIKRYDTIDVAFQDLAIGAIDAVVADGPPSARYTEQLKEMIKVAGKPFTTETYAIALQQGDTTLKEGINVALKEMAKNGKLQELIQKWNLQDVAMLPEGLATGTTLIETKTSVVADLKGRKLVIGSDTTYPPMEFVDEKTKQIVGFDVDMMNEVATLINATIEFRTFPNFDAIFAALANKEFDLVVSSVSVTEERKKIIDFSDPYLSIGQVICVQKSNATITSQTDLAVAERVGVQGGTTGEEAAKKAGVPEKNIKRYDTIDVAFQDLATGAIDAVVADGPPSARYTGQLKDQIKIIGKPFTTENYAIAMQQNNPQLKDAINAAIKELKSNGKMQQLMERWNLQDVATLP